MFTCKKLQLHWAPSPRGDCCGQHVEFPTVPTVPDALPEPSRFATPRLVIVLTLYFHFEAESESQGSRLPRSTQGEAEKVLEKARDVPPCFPISYPTGSLSLTLQGLYLCSPISQKRKRKRPKATQEGRTQPLEHGRKELAGVLG